MLARVAVPHQLRRPAIQVLLRDPDALAERTRRGLVEDTHPHAVSASANAAICTQRPSISSPARFSANTAATAPAGVNRASSAWRGAANAASASVQKWPLPQRLPQQKQKQRQKPQRPRQRQRPRLQP